MLYLPILRHIDVICSVIPCVSFRRKWYDFVTGTHIVVLSIIQLGIDLNIPRWCLTRKLVQERRRRETGVESSDLRTKALVPNAWPTFPMARIPYYLSSAELGYSGPTIRSSSGSRLRLRSSHGGAISSDLGQVTAIDASPPTEAFRRPMRDNQATRCSIVQLACSLHLPYPESLAMQKLGRVWTKKSRKP